RLAYSLVRDEARAEDLVQETWATWVEERPSGLAEPRAWLARVMRNRAFNQKRGDARRAEREELSGRPDASAPEIDGTLEAQAQLIEALRHLEEPYRSALVERYYHDLSPREIAERSGTPLNTIKARLVRGLAKLREAMDRRYGGDRRAWCHWLTIPGAPPIAAGAPAGSGRAAPASGGGQGLAPFAGVGGSGGMTLLGWLVLGAVLVAGAVMQSGWGRAPHKDAPVEDGQASVPLRETVAPEESGRVEVPTEAAPRRAKTPLERPESLGYVSSEPEVKLPARAAIPELARTRSSRRACSGSCPGARGSRRSRGASCTRAGCRSCGSIPTRACPWTWREISSSRSCRSSSRTSPSGRQKATPSPSGP